MKKMASWGDCTERQARRNFAQLEAGKVIHRVGAENGGRRLATEWIVDPKGLSRWLILIGANPSPKLVDLLDTILIGGARYPEAQLENPDMDGEKPERDRFQNPDIGEAEIDPETRTRNPDKNPDTMSARREERGCRRAVVASGATAQRHGGGT
jgi:hypothetical protein